MARNYEKEIDEVKNDIGALRSDMEKLIKSLANDAGERGREAYSEARKKAREGAAYTEKKIEENPMTCIAASFGIGLILGRIMSR